MNNSMSIVSATLQQAVVASYKSHLDAEAAVHRLATKGLPVKSISIVGHNFETRQVPQGFYSPSDAMLVGAGQGAWRGGLFGLLLGAGLFIFPTVGALTVLGPLSGMVAFAIGGAGVGALVNGLMAAGLSQEAANEYQDRLQKGEYLVVVHGDHKEAAEAHAILKDTNPTHLQAHDPIVK